MWNFINRNYWNTLIIVLVVLVIVCGISSYLQGGSETPTFVQNTLNSVFTPIKTGVSTVTGGIYNFFADIKNSKNAATENRTLKNQIKQLQNENARLNEFKEENDRLRNLLEFKEKTTKFDLTPCEVVGRTMSDWNTEFIINKGTDDGIDIGAIIIQNSGLVGKVTLAGKNWAKVTTLLDSESSVSVTVIRSGAYGIVEGDIKLAGENMCAMNYTEKDSDIAIGDVVETSGLGKVFPQGIVVGKVKSVEQISGSVERKITVELSADIYNLKEVMAITSY